MIKLYGPDLSPYVRKVKVGLYEKALDFESLVTDTRERVDELHRLNPHGEVPALIDGDVVVADSTLALHYLEDQYPEKPLLPRDPVQRTKAYALEDLGDRRAESIIYALAQVYLFGMPQLEGQVVPAAERELHDLYSYLEPQVSDSGYFCDEFSWADMSLFPQIAAARGYKLGPDPDTFPKVAGWLKFCRSRPSISRNLDEVRAAMAAGPPIPELPDGHPHLGLNYRGERGEFFVRNGMSDYLHEYVAKGMIRAGLPLMHTVES